MSTATATTDTAQPRTTSDASSGHFFLRAVEPTVAVPGRRRDASDEESGPDDGHPP